MTTHLISYIYNSEGAFVTYIDPCNSKVEVDEVYLGMIT